MGMVAVPWPPRSWLIPAARPLQGLQLAKTVREDVMSSKFKRLLGVITACGLLALGLSAVATAPAHATGDTGGVMQSGPFEVGNLLDYANADFEGTTGDWVDVSNAQLTVDTSHQYLHNDSLLVKNTVPGPGTSTTSFKLGVQINLTPGAKYRIGTYFKAPQIDGQTVQFSLGCYDSGNHWLGWYTDNMPPHPL